MPLSFWLIVLFIFGLIIGSFLNVVILRIDELETIWRSRSHCPKCRHILGWSDLIPFFSFVLLRTRCRYCGVKISWQYPLVEIGTGLVFVWLYYYLVHLGNLSFWAFIPLIFAFCAFIVVFVYDLKTMTIPMEVLGFALLMIIVYWITRSDWLEFKNALAGGLIMGLVPLTMIVLGQLLFKTMVMGEGDIYLGLILGLVLNFRTGILALILSFIIGGIISLILILLGKTKLGRFDQIAFGPFLVLGSFIALIWGTKLLNTFLIY